LVLTNAAGRTAYRLGDLKRAVELFYSAPKTALVSAAFELRITFLNNYASALRLSGSVVQAERIFNAALEELSPHRDVFGDLYSMVLNNIGVILTSRKDYTGADHIYRDAIDVRRNLHINDDLSLAQIHNNYAELKWRQGATRESKWLHAMALRTRLKVLGSVSLPVYESINNIGAIAREEKEYAAAEKCLRTTIDLAENLVGRRHFQYGSTLNNFGMLLASRGELEEALIYLKTAVEIIHASIMGGSPIEETVRQNLLNIEIAAAKDRVYGNTVKDSVILGSLTQESITGSRKERSMKAPQQKVSGSKIGGPVRLQSDVKVDQEFVKSSAASLDMIIRTKRGRERLSKSLERLAKSAEEKGEVPEEDARKLRDAADQARGGEMHKALTTLGSVSEKLVGFAEKIGASVAAKAIEHALQI
jgi:tetratricopeptide (TPR) repeat protein